MFKKVNELVDTRFFALVAGESGVGKTRLVTTLPFKGDEVLIVSAESGLLSIKGSDYSVCPVPFKNKTTIQTLDFVLETVYGEYGKNIKCLYLDSLTEIVEKVLEELKKDPKLSDPKNTFLLWGKLKEIMKSFLKALRDLPEITVVFTCLTAKEKNGLILEDVYKMPGSLKDDLKPMFDFCFHYKTFKDENENVIRKLITSDTESPLAKDRSGLLSAYEDASLSIIINKLKGV